MSSNSLLGSNLMSDANAFKICERCEENNRFALCGDTCIKKDLFVVLTALYWLNQKACAQQL